jgi:hypothetical protein
MSNIASLGTGTIVAGRNPDTAESFHLKAELRREGQWAHANTAEFLKSVHRFQIKLECDTSTQIGVDNEWSPVW